jgi:hypothetical protein
MPSTALLRRSAGEGSSVGMGDGELFVIYGLETSSWGW